MTTDETTNSDVDGSEMLETLNIKKVTQREVGGRWVDGTIAGHRFQALVFAGHADVADYELGDSRISKFWMKRTADGKVVANFDRGWDIRPTTPEAEQIVDLLAAGLAETVFAD